ncbi:hypothetical protein D3C85_1581980 [compost metagenome]
MTGTIELTTVLFAAPVVAIGNAIAMRRVMLPILLIDVDPVVAVDVVVAFDVDVDVVIAPVTFTPQRTDDSHTGAKRQPGQQCLAGVIGRRWWVVRRR